MHPVAFHLGGFAIYWYGILIAAGFLAGLWTASRRGLRDGIPGERIVDMGPWLIVGALVGSRLFFVVFYWEDYFAGQPWREIFMIRKGGMVFYGGFAGSLLAGAFYIRRKKLPLWKTIDVLAPSAALGYALGRLGCFLNGCCYGKICSLPWAVRFPGNHETFPNAVHPTQLYEALSGLALYVGLAWAYRHKRFDGQISAAYLVGYAGLRFLTEFSRGDYTALYLGGWATPAQVFSLLLATAGVLLWRQLSPKPRP